MKKSLIKGFFISLMLLFIFAIPVSAASLKKLQTGKTYSLDLNGGAKEKIKVTYQKSGWKREKWKLYVNNKVVATYSFKDPYEASVDVYYLDVNKSDKYHELLIISTGVNSLLDDMRIIRYSNSKSVKKIRGKQKDFKGRVGRLSPVSCDGKNKITFYLDTPFFNGTFGCYLARVTGTVSGTTFSFSNASSYPLKTKDPDHPNNYELYRSMKLYKNANKKTVLKTLSAGTRFTPTSFKPVNPRSQSGRWSAYVKVKTTDGKVGWLYFPNEGYKYLSQMPAWA